jgi:hypothetical protein
MRHHMTQKSDIVTLPYFWDAKNKIKEIIEQVVAKEALPGGFNPGKYKV